MSGLACAANALGACTSRQTTIIPVMNRWMLPWFLMTRTPSGQRPKKFAVSLDVRFDPELLQRPPDLAHGAAHHRLAHIVFERLNHCQRRPRRRGDQHRIAGWILSPDRSHMAK